MKRDPKHPEWLGQYIESPDGVPIPCYDMQEWNDFLEHRKHVAKTTVGEHWVSTVFLGLDHQWGDGPPLLYETMVFENEEKMTEEVTLPSGAVIPSRPYHESLDDYAQRHSTRELALEWHRHVVAELEDKMLRKNPQ